MAILNCIFLWLPVIFYAGIIFSVSAIPGSTIPKNLPPDYLLHCSEYIPFGFLVVRAFHLSLKKSQFRLFALIASITLVMLYGASDELHQFLVPGRDVSVIDFAADCLGGFIGIALGYLFYRKVISHPPSQKTTGF